jgi:hypothetical protein
MSFYDGFVDILMGCVKAVNELINGEIQLIARKMEWGLNFGCGIGSNLRIDLS